MLYPLMKIDAFASFFRPLLAAVSVSAVLALSSPLFGADVDLIPRDLLFGNPTRSSPQLSPDGTMLAFLAPRDGVMNLWVCPIGKLEEAKPLTAEKSRPLPFYFWSTNSEDLLYVQDSAGDENYLLYGANARTGVARKLTDFPKTRVNLYGTSWVRPDEVVIGLNNRDAKWHDAWLLNIKSGALTLLYENKDNLSGYILDDSLQLRYGVRSRPDGGWEMLKFGGEGKKLEVYTTVEYEDSDNTSLAGLTQDGKTLYLRDSRGRDKSVLKSINVDTGAEAILAEDPRVDIGGAFRHPVTGRVEGYRVSYLRSEWHALDATREADFAFLSANVQGEWNPVSMTKDARRWIVGRNDATAPGEFLLYDREAMRITKLFTARPDLVGKPLVPMHPLELKARDGLTLVSYLTLPAGTDANNDGRPEQPVPMVLFVHGGPWARDGYGFNSMHQWLANRGYAVLSVNFRGSTGFGKTFIRAGDKEWGGKMHDDLIDAVNWAVRERIAPKDKIAIMGGSYGGYATLVGLSFTPDIFACGVDIVGPANLATLMSTIPPYWEAARVKFARAIGDVATDEGKKLLAERSPLTPRSSDPAAAADWTGRKRSAGEAGGVGPDCGGHEGEEHPCHVRTVSGRRARVRPSGKQPFIQRDREAFLADHLGGRVEPVGDDFKGASLKVLEGADQVPALPAALAAAKSP